MSKHRCDFCEVQRLLCQSWISAGQLPRVGTVEQNDAVNLALDALRLAHDLYDHDCEGNVSNETLRRRFGDVS